MKSPYRLDHDKVIVPEGDSLLAVIPLSARNMVLTLCEYMNWPAFWRVNPPNELEWDNIRSIIAEIEQSMSTAISVQLLDGRLEEIKTAIEGIESGGSECDCAAIIDALGALALATVAGDVPASAAGDNPHLDVGDLAAVTTSSDVCGYVKVTVEAMAETLRQLAPLMRLGWVAGIAAGAIILIAAWPFGLLTVGFALSGNALLGIWASINAYTEAQMIADSEWLLANLDNLTCKVTPLSINTADDIYTIMTTLKNEYPPAAKALAWAIYTKGLATEHAAGEWANADCPECTEGCGGLSWNFQNTQPECWSMPANGTANPLNTGLGLEVTAGWNSMRTTQSLIMPTEKLAGGVATYKLRWTWTGFNTSTNHRCRIDIMGRVKGNTGSYSVVWASGSNLFNGTALQYQTQDSPTFTINGETHDYLIRFSFTSWTGVTRTILKSIFLIQA